MSACPSPCLSCVPRVCVRISARTRSRRLCGDIVCCVVLLCRVDDRPVCVDGEFAVWQGAAHLGEGKWVVVEHDMFQPDVPEQYKLAMAIQVRARLPTCPPPCIPACPPACLYIVSTHAWVLCCGAQILQQQQATTDKEAALVEVEKLKGPPLPLPARTQ